MGGRLFFQPGKIDIFLFQYRKNGRHFILKLYQLRFSFGNQSISEYTCIPGKTWYCRFFSLLMYPVHRLAWDPGIFFLIFLVHSFGSH